MFATIHQVANRSFDYVICGGGTAGLTLAARLSEDPNVTVLVLEAGGANLNDWSIRELNPLREGKGLGGSTQINYMSWTKPPANEIDAFERLGNPGWNWENHQKYVKRTEGFVVPGAEMQKRNGLSFDTVDISTDGPLKIAYPGTIEEAELKIQETFINGGISVAPCPFNGDPEGAYWCPSTYDPTTHTRSYATTAFYVPNEDRKNLIVLLDAYVTRIITKRSTAGAVSAKGAEFEHEDGTYVVNARAEIILSAGSLKSPHILELSGIGRREVLERIGAPFNVNLPGVGENLQDHIVVAAAFGAPSFSSNIFVIRKSRFSELRDEVEWETADLLRDPVLEAKHHKLHAQGEGIYTTNILNMAFVSLATVTDKSDILYEATKTKIAENAHTYPPGLMDQYEIQLERMQQRAPGCEIICIPGFMSVPNPPEMGKRYVSLCAVLDHPFSRGVIHSKSANPHDEPDIDPRYFEQEIDLDILTELLKFVRGLANLAPLKDMIGVGHIPRSILSAISYAGPYMPAPAHVKQFVGTIPHATSTCSMLPRERGGVVDSSLKVYGTTNLRVVDLSVVPLIFAAHPMETVFAIAEQAADIIKGTFSA
ncbi:uncharacterized protein FIBRA_07457 [Fibroporia radiculosa]|uniref:Glucose-methanol-choline oxidoreductase N-terminal domain-containing protein n=1 Tax=Fibroporia radiculosa TaxID=599839 RepID=J4I0Q2_9APHY|nr:uncharacterized protein FIBRA_07457 [Fibroporia radiculosa]CCM05247.1 predicted protein [Fibroporia radiculosa]